MKVVKPVYNILFYILLTLAQICVRILYPIRTVGRENLISGKGFVIACNHIFAIDPMFVILGRGFRKKMLAMGKEELFGLNFLLDFFWKVAGVFAIDRGAGNRAVVEQAMGEVKKGRGLLIFPEGTRSKDGSLKRLKSGAFVVAMEAGVDMIPTRIIYKGGKPRPFHTVTIVFGKPVSLEELGLAGRYSVSQVAQLREAKKMFTNKMEELLDANRQYQ